jgi:hypothetical protein
MNYKIFCDESCHLQYDGFDIMVLGALECPENEYEQIKNDIKSIKDKFHTNYELKWTKVSSSRGFMYKELIDYFFDSNMRYRAVIVKNKTKLDHDRFGQTHSVFYYKTYYLVLKYLMNQRDNYKIYFDKKDTRGKIALDKLREVFDNSKELPTPFLQHIQAQESQHLQLVDLFTGAVSYKNRDLDSSKIKLKIIHYLEQKSGIKLDMTSPLNHDKFNIFIQNPLRNL